MVNGTHSSKAINLFIVENDRTLITVFDQKPLHICNSVYKQLQLETFSYVHRLK